MNTPQYRHDCASCTYLGSSGGADLYHCPGHGLPTLIARRSSAPSDYTSMLAELVIRDARLWAAGPLETALDLARARNLPLGGGLVVGW